METFKEPHGHKGRVSITDPNYSTARRKKKRFDKLSIPEVNNSNQFFALLPVTSSF